ncbi:MAG: hypothetical protein FRX48_06616 [Lasallia pustulata]|uniref:Uncharacterized protein n=1 Tax=Lasallia pustulata TaxID=136370 RepID=A0A5M8PM63_9LECA|nr:MAG: hypothetical protein FRX48_06616 [Lasallia pustulata]
MAPGKALEKCRALQVCADPRLRDCIIDVEFTGFATREQARDSVLIVETDAIPPCPAPWGRRQGSKLLVASCQISTFFATTSDEKLRDGDVRRGTSRC